MSLLTAITVGWRGYAAAAAVAATVAGFGAWEVRGWMDASSIASHTTAQSKAERQISDLAAVVARNEADIERARATAEAEYAARVEDLARQLADTQSRLSLTERARETLSRQLTQELNHAQPSDARPLGPAVRRYLDRLRAHATGTADRPASP